MLMDSRPVARSRPSRQSTASGEVADSEPSSMLAPDDKPDDVPDDKPDDSTIRSAPDASAWAPVASAASAGQGTAVSDTSTTSGRPGSPGRLGSPGRSGSADAGMDSMSSASGKPCMVSRVDDAGSALSACPASPAGAGAGVMPVAGTPPSSAAASDARSSMRRSSVLLSSRQLSNGLGIVTVASSCAWAPAGNRSGSVSRSLGSLLRVAARAPASVVGAATLGSVPSFFSCWRRRHTRG